MITWRGTDAPEHETQAASGSKFGNGPWTREYTSEREALGALGSIELYQNLELVSATITLADPAPFDMATVFDERVAIALCRCRPLMRS